MGLGSFIYLKWINQTKEEKAQLLKKQSNVSAD
jgi:hypothetical protein